MYLISLNTFTYGVPWINNFQNIINPQKWAMVGHYILLSCQLLATASQSLETGI